LEAYCTRLFGRDPSFHQDKLPGPARPIPVQTAPTPSTPMCLLSESCTPAARPVSRRMNLIHGSEKIHAGEGRKVASGEKNKIKRFNAEDAENTEGIERKEADSGQLTVNKHSCGFFSRVLVQARPRVARFETRRGISRFVRNDRERAGSRHSRPFSGHLRRGFGMTMPVGVALESCQRQ
jgi:hypothetical protein